MTPADAFAQMRRTLGADNGPSDPFGVFWEHESPERRADILRRVLSPERLAGKGQRSLMTMRWVLLTPAERAEVKLHMARLGAPGIGLELQRSS